MVHTQMQVFKCAVQSSPSYLPVERSFSFVLDVWLQRHFPDCRGRNSLLLGWWGSFVIPQALNLQSGKCRSNGMLHLAEQVTVSPIQDSSEPQNRGNFIPCVGTISESLGLEYQAGARYAHLLYYRTHKGVCGASSRVLQQATWFCSAYSTSSRPSWNCWRSHNHNCLNLLIKL